MIMCEGTICSKRGHCRGCDRYEYFKSKREIENKSRQLKTRAINTCLKSQFRKDS